MRSILPPWRFSCLLTILLLISGCDVARCELVESVLELNDTAAPANVTGFVSASRSWSLRLEVEDINSERAIRVSTSSVYADLSFPLLISVRQGRHISSWTLPFIEAGHASPVVSRTLCPLLNRPIDDNSTVNIIYIDISTPSFNNVSFNVSASIINQYQLRIDNPVNEVVSASSPVSYVFEYPEGVDRVLVKVTSSSSTCALVSVQEGLCPVDQLLDYPDHRGTFQTMQLLSAINMKRPVHQNFIYIVVSVYHHDNCSETNHDFFDGLVTFNTADISYAVACIVLVVAFGLLVIGIGLFFVFDELFCYRCHATYKFLKKFKEEEGIRDIFEEVDGNKRKCNNCIKYIKKILAIIKGRQWLDDELDRLFDAKEERILRMNGPSSNSEDIPTDGSTGYVEETDFSHIRRRNSYNCATSDDEPEEIIEIRLNNHQNHDTKIAIDQTNTVSTNTVDQTNVMSDAIDPQLNPVDPVPNTVDPVPNTVDPVPNTVDPVPNPVDPVPNPVDPVPNRLVPPSTLYNRFRGSLLKSDEPYLNKLKFVDGKEFQDNYNPYWAYLLTIVIFYSLPVYQLVLTYQRYVSVSGSEDFCYYNTLCSHPLWGLSAFNNVWSNVSFLFLGVLFIFLAIRRRSIYRVYESINIYYERKGKSEMKVGVPQYFGIYYASGIALIGEALMSGAYHICPTGNNYQFDTTMMFVLVTLGIYQLFKSRNPDIIPSPHKLLLILSSLILFIAFGVIYSSLAFYILFFIIYEVGVVFTSLQLYYRWMALDIFKEIVTDVNCAIQSMECTRLFTCTAAIQSMECSRLFKRFTPSCPHDNIRFIYLVVLNLINFIWSLALLIMRPRDFATNFLSLLIFNYLLSLLFVLLVKLPAHHYNNCGRRRALLKPFIYLSFSISFWLAGLYFYLQGVTNWLESPAVSRNENKECFFLSFYDTHDMWHICSAFGIFFSFLLMMTLEDHVEFKKRSEIRVY